MTRPLLLTLALALLTPALADAYTVQAGDTAYSVARRAGLSVDQLLTLNALTSPNLRAGQVLNLTLSAPSPSSVTYTVAPGDTAYNIARRANLSVDALLSLNNLSSADLRLGQVLTLPVAIAPLTPSSAPAPLRAAAPTLPPVSALSVTALPTGDIGADLRALGTPWLGAPYVWGGASTTGVDCSGLTMELYAQLGVKLPHQSAQQFTLGDSVDRDTLEPGDLVFFDTEGGGHVTHVGIYLGDDEFINANSYLGRVSIDKLSSTYFATRYLGARRLTPPLTARRGL
ncbi:C40 family peptidase [Deinococcus maricopensis]|uniref:NLP/P60 protein n=1 Tax=Deinococcus maricopensis (strain DSM 21211 / LMG 22137 / NRRL B-23946 / LB-34) TaxID=709986 RepID=E8U7J6_DEIML|nr:C40 family peptidase [Deinococcus maricopensis]ADV67035.1 NLP/P60 protein [Deinococcus maricopensis DSM 21211]